MNDKRAKLGAIGVLPERLMNKRPYLIDQIQPNMMMALPNCNTNASMLIRNDLIFVL